MNEKQYDLFQSLMQLLALLPWC